MKSQVFFASLAGLCSFRGAIAANQSNIVVIMSDDQDLQLGSLETQSVIQQQIISQGVLLPNHFVTVSQCCPSRVSYLRGQAAHNTNNTYVSPPGGGYSKLLASGEDKDWLPQWLSNAGYATEYIGKLANGLNLANYNPKAKGWTHSDLLSRQNRISHIPKRAFYLQIAPTAPHVSTVGESWPVPCKRHLDLFPDATVQNISNFNPSDNYTEQKVAWLQTLPSLDASQLTRADRHHRMRLQALQGVDDIVEDVINLLEQKGILDNTYVIYTSDNGYHIGNHRVQAGKTLPYIEDTNVPFAVRGPGIPKGKISTIPSTHIDMAPTFLDIAQVATADLPAFLDGRSLLSSWQNPTNSSDNTTKSGTAKEIINIEIWGPGKVENGTGVSSGYYYNNGYKTLRIVSESSSWLFSRWCTNETELYDTKNDFRELTNLAINPSTEHQQLMNRLNALLLVTKSCSGDTCRNPWSAFNISVTNLDDALSTTYDSYFASFPSVAFAECMTYQYIPNEYPFYPESSVELGRDYRNDTDNFGATFQTNVVTINYTGVYGTWAQRNSTLATIMETAQNLTDAEIGDSETCYYSENNYCGQGGLKHFLSALIACSDSK